MTQSIINTLFGAPNTTPSAKPAQPAANASAGAQSFGNVLSRELNGRSAQAPRPNTQSNMAEAANLRARQQQHRLEERQQANTAARQSDASNRASSDSVNAKQAANTAKIDKNDKTGNSDRIDQRRATKRDDDDSAQAPNAASTAAQSAAANQSPNTAAANNAGASKTAQGDASATGVSSAPSGTAVDTLASASIELRATLEKNGVSDGLPGEATEAGDAAFEAMVAQAAQSAQLAQATQSAKATPSAVSASTDGLAKATRSGQEAAQTATRDLFAGSTANSTRVPLADSIDQSLDEASPASLKLAAASSALPIDADAVNAGNAAGAGDPALLTALPSAALSATTGIVPGTGTAPGDKLTPFVGTSAWDQALGHKIVWMAAGAQQSASLTLNPPDLGPLQVVINVTHAHAEASFSAAQPEVRAALEAAMPKLKEMLADAGISLGQSSVNAGMPNQHGNQANQNQYGAGSQGARAAGAAPDASAQATPLPRGIRQVGGNGMVDTFA